MMVNTFHNAAQALQHVAAAHAAQGSGRPQVRPEAPFPEPRRASHEDSPAGSGTDGRTVTVTVTLTVRDGGRVDLVL